MLLIAALFVISCGDGETTEEGGNKPCTEAEKGNFKCSGDVSMTCNGEVWTNYEQCSAEKPCSKTTGKCEAKSDNSGDNGGDNGGNNGGNEGGDNGNQGGDTAASLNCAEIYQCMTDCGADQTCQENCYNSGSANGQSQVYALIQCLNGCYSEGMTNEEFSECANSQCETEISNCEGFGAGAPADENYHSPYGSLALNFSIAQIANDSDAANQQSTVGIGTAAFATGTYGNGTMSVTPADAYMIQSSAMYSVDAQYGNSIGIQQVPVYLAGNQPSGGNPIVMLQIPEENAAVGTLEVSAFQDAQAMLYVVDINWTTQQISCFHAFGDGSINITALGDYANHGNISLTGNVTLYSPKNFDKYGDISSGLTVPVCNPVQ